MGLGRTEIIMFISEVICILFYGLFVRMGDGVNAGIADPDKGNHDMDRMYPMF